MNTFKTLLFVVLGISFFSCCKKELPEPPVVLNCPAGFEEQGDSCFCPSENWVLDQECRPLETNEYYSILPDDIGCWAGDTMVAKFDWTKEKCYFSSRERTVKEDLVIVQNAVGVDSFYTRRIHSWFTLFDICDINGERASGQVVGFKSTGDTILAKLYLRSYSTWYDTILDSCDLTFVK